MNAKLVVLFFAFLCGMTEGFAQTGEFKCQRPFPEMALEYPKLVCDGNELFERGRINDALMKYLKASQLVFFESPNFLIYYRIASAQLALGRGADAKKTLSEFSDMLDIYDGKKSCTRNESVEAKAIDVMCSESFDPEAYKSETGMSKRRHIALLYRERIRVLRK